MGIRVLLWLTLALILGAAAPAWGDAEYLVGIGKSDITGPTAEVNLLGYANIKQTAHGLHIRNYARAYIFASAAEPSKRVLFVNIDACMPSQLLTMKVVRQLQVEYDGLYTIDNTVIVATHTHASMAGYLQYLLYSLTSLGFVPDSFKAMQNGILKAVKEAHATMKPSQLSLSSGELLNANLNRSPTAYLNNPKEERARYKYDTDKTMTVLKIQDAKGSGRGLLSWFPVHPTSMSNHNTLISGDNKGAAEQFTEQGWGLKVAGGRKRGFVAGFVQANHADTTPNLLGAFCGETEERCDIETSTCAGDNQKCLARGPGYPDEFESTRVLGQRQADKAEELWKAKGSMVKGPIDSRHLYFNITNMEVLESKYTRAGRTCIPAMGYSFAAGTTDGPGAPMFHQSERQGANPFWTPISRLIHLASRTPPTDEQTACHAPKPILLNVGAAQKPYPFVPSVVEVSVLRIGNLVSVHVSAEFTTMAGRRLREAVYDAVKDAWGADVVVLMASVTNTYASYATTFEEYQVQRYEGGSTLYGPHTSDAYIQTAVQLADAMLKGKPVVSQVSPPDLESKQWSLLPPVIMDAVPIGSKFGEVLKEVKAEYRRGDLVQVTFRGANPRNNMRLGGSFLEVQRFNETDGTWALVHTDADWCTKFLWARSGTAESESTVLWDIPATAAAGTYRIKHYGDFKGFKAGVRSFEGYSGKFLVREGEIGAAQVTPLVSSGGGNGIKGARSRSTKPGGSAGLKWPSAG